MHSDQTLKLFAGDSECQIKAEGEICAGQGFFFSLKILPEVCSPNEFHGPQTLLGI